MNRTFSKQLRWPGVLLEMDTYPLSRLLSHQQCSTPRLLTCCPLTSQCLTAPPQPAEGLITSQDRHVPTQVAAGNKTDHTLGELAARHALERGQAFQRMSCACAEGTEMQWGQRPGPCYSQGFLRVLFSSVTQKTFCASRGVRKNSGKSRVLAQGTAHQDLGG